MSMGQTPFRRWLKSQGMMVGGGGGGCYTHLLMDGGKVMVPEERMTEFYAEYAKDVSRGEPNYVVEQRTDVFPFLVDLDLFGTEAVSGDRVREYVSLITETLVDFYESVPPVYVFARPPGSASKGGVAGVKSGVHLVFPGLNVRGDVAMMLRDAILIRALQQFPDEPWEDTIDASVYKKNGLRMPGSRKMEPCSDCMGANCLACRGRKRVDVGKVYVPYCVLDSSGKNNQEELQLILSDAFEMVRKSAVRTETGTEATSYQRPDWFPEGGIGAGKRAPLKRKLASMQQPSSSSSSSSSKKFTECQDEALLQAVAYFVERNFPKSPTVQKLLVLSSEATAPRFYLAHSNGRFCQNKGDNHDRSNVYFHVNGGGIRQKCFCQCPEKRQPSGKTCKEYSGPIIKLSTVLRKKLFPKQQQSDGGKQEAQQIGTISLFRGHRTGVDPLTLEKGRAMKSFIQSL